MKTLRVDLELLATQLNAMAEHCICNEVRPEWYDGLSSMLAEIEMILSRSGEVRLIASEGGEL